MGKLAKVSIKTINVSFSLKTKVAFEIANVSFEVALIHTDVSFESL